MVSPVKEVASNAGASSRLAAAESSADATLAELRDSVASLAKDIAAIAEARTRGVRDAAMGTAEAGASELRKTIRRQPVVAVAVALGAGAILALALTPRSGRRPRTSRWEVTRADLYDMADTIQRSVSRGAQSIPSLTPAFERLVDAITRGDASASVSSVVEKASSWFQKLRSRAAEKTK